MSNHDDFDADELEPLDRPAMAVFAADDGWWRRLWAELDEDGRRKLLAGELSYTSIADDGVANGAVYSRLVTPGEAGFQPSAMFLWVDLGRWPSRAVRRRNIWSTAGARGCSNEFACGMRAGAL